MLHTKKMNIARMDRLITIMQPVLGSSTSKGPNITGYEEINDDPEVWSMVRNKLGDEVVQNDAITHVQQTIFTIRYRDDLSLTNTIVHESKMYAIHSFAEMGEVRKGFLEITGEYMKEYVIT